MPAAGAARATVARRDKKRVGPTVEDQDLDGQTEAEVGGGALEGTDAATKLRIMSRTATIGAGNSDGNPCQNSSSSSQQPDSLKKKKSPEADGPQKMPPIGPVGILMFKEPVKYIYDHKYSQISIALLIVANFIINMLEKQIDPSGTVTTSIIRDELGMPVVGANGKPLRVGVFISFEDFFNVVFSFEAGLRFVSYYPLSSGGRDPILYLDVLTVLPFWLRLLVHPSSMTPDGYLDVSRRGMTIRVLEAFSSLRLLKLCRYYDGATLLVHAISHSLQQLFVPLFALAIMVFTFASGS